MYCLRNLVHTLSPSPSPIAFGSHAERSHLQGAVGTVLLAWALPVDLRKVAFPPAG